MFETFRKSIYNPAFYQSVASAPLTLGIRYYLKFSLLLAVVMTIALSILLIPAGVLFIKKYAPEVVEKHFPKELTVSIEKGIATANVPMPYFVRTNNVEVNVGGAVAQPTLARKNILVIDTTKEFDKSTFDGYNTYALLTKSDIVTTNDNGQITIQSLNKIPNSTINQSTLLVFVDNIKNYLGAIVIIGIIVTFIIIFLGYLMYLVPLLLFALIPRLIAYLRKIPMTYGSAYKISMYAIIPALALKTLLNVVGVFFIPTYFTLLVFMLIIAMNLKEATSPTLFEEGK